MTNAKTGMKFASYIHKSAGTTKKQTGNYQNFIYEK